MYLRRFIWGTVIVIALAALCVMLVVWRVESQTESHIYTDVKAVPTAPVAIVFGALVNPNGTLSPILKDRVDGAIALYKAGTVKKILMTGDNSTATYNEVGAMKTYAVAQGVVDADITLDYAGFSTYDSCYRAKNIFGVSQAVLVTQEYHAPRALYDCRSLGINASAYGVADFSKYPDLRVKYTVREWLADVESMFEVHAHVLPKFLGPKETIQ